MTEDDFNAEGWIQWKGTDVCMDIRCKCGELTHVDEEFLYYVRCGKCKQLYEVQGEVVLKPIDIMPAECEYEAPVSR